MFASFLKSASAAALLLAATPIIAQAGELEFEGETWTAGDNEGSDARIEDYLGRQALFLRRNVAALTSEELGDMKVASGNLSPTEMLIDHSPIYLSHT